jgi:hypothetical protein
VPGSALGLAWHERDVVELGNASKLDCMYCSWQEDICVFQVMEMLSCLLLFPRLLEKQLGS